MVFGWAYRRILKGAIKKLNTDPEVQNEVRNALISVVSGSIQGQNKPEMQSAEQNEPISGSPVEAEGSVSTVPEGYVSESSGDIVLDGFLAQFRHAVEMHDAKGIAYWGDRVTERQRYLRRAEAGFAARQRQLEEPPQTATNSNIDIKNLAPYADQLARELLSALDPLTQRLGVAVPKNIKIGNMEIDTSKFLADKIRENPDAIAKVLQSLQGLLQRYVPSRGGGGGIGAQGPFAGFDPSNPDTWPETWRQAGQLFGGGV
jgi:hypothetical protein